MTRTDDDTPTRTRAQVRRNPIFEEMRQQMDAVVAAVHPKRERDGEERKKRTKETLADRVEKAVAISMTEEEKANIERERREAAMYWPVCLNPKLKPKGSEVSEDRKTFTSSKGYRTCAASHGVRCGAFYYEITIAYLGESGHARVGWKSKKGEANAPVGFDKFGYGYRDVGGEKVHESTLAPYGEPFKEGDVIGCYIFVEEMKMKSLKKEESGDAPEPANASFVAFSRNGTFQGKAYVGLNDDDGAQPQLKIVYPAAEGATRAGERVAARGGAPHRRGDAGPLRGAARAAAGRALGGRRHRDRHAGAQPADGVRLGRAVVRQARDVAARGAAGRGAAVAVALLQAGAGDAAVHASLLCERDLRDPERPLAG